jgi:hypothetical protein
MTDHDFDRGDRVLTPGGIGTIVYKRMAPPDYAHAAAYSVYLERDRARVGYAGTIYPAADVTAAPLEDAGTETCDECGADVQTTGDMVSEDHATSCSLYPSVTAAAPMDPSGQACPTCGAVQDCTPDCMSQTAVAAAVRDWDRREAAHARHAAADPHCTCNDCMADFARASADVPAGAPYKVHIGYTTRGRDRWRMFPTLEAATAFCEAVHEQAGVVLSVTRATPAVALRCDMTRDCDAPVAYVDIKGYVFCAKHGIARRCSQRCRKLTPAERRRLERGDALKAY